MRAFWAWFGFGTTAMAPMGMYFTAFLYLMDHVIRSSGTEVTITDVGSMVVVLVLLPWWRGRSNGWAAAPPSSSPSCRTWVGSAHCSS
ncbi:hypothetical protein G7085_15185 [Tessaracoccus sp. HDW20]|nr:hypothetical protein [Tessaracoccus coleopterorum]